MVCNLPVVSIVVPFWGLPYRILIIIILLIMGGFPFWVPNIVRHLLFRVPKKGT